MDSGLTRKLVTHIRTLSSQAASHRQKLHVRVGPNLVSEKAWFGTVVFLLCGGVDAEEISTLDLLSFLKTVNIVLTGGVPCCRHVSSRAMSEGTTGAWHVLAKLH